MALSTRKSLLLPNNGVYEGFRVIDGGASWGPDSTENASVRESGDRFILAQRHRGLETVKSIRLLDDSLEIAYTFNIMKNINRLLVTYPLLLSDGRIETELQIRRSIVTFAFGDERYRLACAEGYSWHHDQERHLISWHNESVVRRRWRGNPVGRRTALQPASRKTLNGGIE